MNMDMNSRMLYSKGSKFELNIKVYILVQGGSEYKDIIGVDTDLEFLKTTVSKITETEPENDTSKYHGSEKCIVLWLEDSNSSESDYYAIEELEVKKIFNL